MRRLAVVSCLCLLGCGGASGTPAVEAAHPEAADEPAEPASSEAAAARAPRDADEPDSEPAGAAEPATREDVQKVLQLVIDDEALQPFLHLEQPGRFPFKIAGRELSPDVELTKATQPVKIVDVPSGHDEAVLVFTEIRITAKKANVRYRYDVEGLKGSAVLSKGEFGWELVNSRQIEHRTKWSEQ